MKVLLAVDGSDESLQAVAEVGRLLKSDRDQAVLYTRAPALAPMDVKSSAQLVHDTELLSKAILEEACSRLPKGVVSQSIAGLNDPRRGILLAAEQSSANLIVVGARGLTMLQRIMLGSVSSAVVHSARVPVWIARPRATQGTPLRVLLACHDPEAALKPAQFLSQLAWPDSTQFSVLVTTASFYGTPVPEWLQQQARSAEVDEIVQRWSREHERQTQALCTRLADVVATLSPPLNTARKIVVEGHPTDKILSTIADEQIDLVVIGSHVHRPIIDTLLGSTAEAVLNHARCSVLVLPHQERP